MVVIGAGLAGLTAAATAARAGRRVVVIERHGGGGRARTDSRGGYRFNQGPHALYRGGPAWAILAEMGVPHRGHRPPLRGARGVRDGALVRLAGAPLARFTAQLAVASARRWSGRTAEEWVESLRGGPDVAGMAVRVSTYVADLGALPADLAITQLKLGLLRGVSYLDGGWASLVDGLASAVSAAGGTIRRHQTVTGINAVPGGWEVALSDGEDLRAAAVVVAAGSPAASRRLLGIDPGWDNIGPAVRAACLDLGVRGLRLPLVFGLDQPLYLARHSPPGDLAPEGGSVVHVMRYGPRDADTDRRELRDHARLAGVGDDHIVEERFLADMVVTHLLPDPRSGLAGRPGVVVADGLYLAGDWVGPTGWLADAAMASGRHAGTLAAGAGIGRPAYHRVP
ncbi:MAG: FAD-dependent oxidoreductase [Acidobacteriota bacterium]|nr:FAD-dependent oxidoreductase [Acidobacteriota bacterium]